MPCLSFDDSCTSAQLTANSEGGLCNEQDYPSLKIMKSHYLRCRFPAVSKVSKAGSPTEEFRLSH